MAKKTHSDPRATQFRRSRRHARYHGLRPRISVPRSTAASSDAVSSVNSDSARWATVTSGTTRSVEPPFRAAPRRSELLLADQCKVELVEDVVHVAAEIHVLVEEVSELPVEERRPRSILHDRVVERRPLRVDGIRQCRLLLQV